MKVIAIERGYDGVTVREPGDEFDVADEMDFHEFTTKDGIKYRTGTVKKVPHTATWFKAAEGDTKGPAKPKKGEKPDAIA